MQQLSLFDNPTPQPVSPPVPPKPVQKLVRPSHPEASRIAAEKVAKTLTKAMIFALGWIEEALNQPRVTDVTSYEVDELAFDVFQTYRGLALSERICGRRFGDLKDAGYITDVGTRESNHKTYRGGRGLVECYQLTEKGLDAVRKHEKWWLSMTAKEYKGKV